MEQIRIVKEMRERERSDGRTGEFIRPRYMVWENVPGALSSNGGNDFAAVLEEIIKIAEPKAPRIQVPEHGWPTWGGYRDMGGRWSVAYRIHDAQWYGVPQRRRRISVVADFGGSTAHKILFEPRSVSGDSAESGAQGERPAGAVESGSYPAVARSLTARYDGSPCVDRGPNIICEPLKQSCLTAWDCQSKRIFETNGVSPTLQGGVGGGVNNPAVFCMATQQGGAEIRSDGKAPTLTAAAGMSGNNQPVVIPINDKATRFRGGGDTRKNDGSGNGLGIGKDGDPAPTITSADKHIVAAFKSNTILDMSHANDVIRECGEVAPSLQARMGTGGNQVPLTYAFQSSSALSESDVASTQSARQYKSPTDLVCAVDCRNFTENGNVNGTLQAKESGGASLNLNNVCRQSGTVRRLTPLECTRLQGFPDGWVDIGEWTDEKGRVHKQADAPKYKALGNSIALPFWKWLLRRISEYLPKDATLGSLFDGIGGFPLCWSEIHGAENCRWASEIEQFPIAVVKRHFGDEDAGIVGDLDEFLRGAVVR